MVGEEGFEPSTSASRTLRAKPSCATPRIGIIVASASCADNQRGDRRAVAAWAEPVFVRRGVIVPERTRSCPARTHNAGGDAGGRSYG